MMENKLTPEELQRYSRQQLLPEVGREGQMKIKNARVLIVGIGGLGSPVALYLAAAGIGTLGLVDDDTVTISNLHRQIIHATSDAGVPKVESARQHLQDLNPHVRMECHNCRLTSSNALELLREYDVIVDGSDNFATRYLINDACALLAKRHVHGSVYRFEGTVSVFGGEGACYCCLHPLPPSPGLIQDCNEAGVFGVLPGMIGAIQANEVLKLILDIGTPLIGRILMVDSLTMTTREHRVSKDPRCAVCGEHPTVKSLIDYERFCGTNEKEVRSAATDRIAEMTVEELKERQDRNEPLILLDVRQAEEYRIANLGGLLIPLGDLPRRCTDLHPENLIVVHCHHGIRSRRAVELLMQSGFPHVRNLAGGIDAWSLRIDSSVPRY